MLKAIKTSKAPAPIGTYSQAIKSGKWVFLSGQIPLTSDGELLSGVGIEEQISQIFRNIQAVANEAGGTLNDVVKLTVYLTDLKLFDSINNVMSDFFSEPYPARSAVEVSRLPKDVSVEVEATMILSSD